ncbi:ATP-binding protein [Bacillus sp. S3]|uniref:ATP-binding protein n=1 Tax=Bacillus sp. S3 TaxID=486398 RepID=UPI00118B65CB|nr:ATP-binding protein [Bacillus sp. S3]QCJ40616.1 ATP-binding protein [Bacillus sp. S3]
MSKPYNPTAGSGDPYWYEWSIGLLYILDMINPDNNIQSVTLQSNKAQGLDDVVVKYKDNTTKCVQIKHSRTGNTITFGDMVSSSENKKSLLKTLSIAWKEAKEEFGNSLPILYTNRKSSIRSTTVKLNEEKEYLRPPLIQFWNTIKGEAESKDSIDEIKICDKWNEAWKIWLQELAELNVQEKLEFLKALTIETDQSDLEEVEREIISKIALTFSINENKAIPIKNALDSALRKWATTLRGKTEEINREEVFQTLSFSSREVVGEHNLKPPYPFFKSRQEFLENLETYLIEGEKQIVFLSGNPGEGKTSIVSSLANRRNSLIDLRFHAYKPITPESPILPADAGKTTTARALWGDLLSQLRTIFKGRLSEFEVPIFNDLMTTEELRSNVIRLSQINGKLKGRPTVIAIDGIDHAARAGIDNETFLSTLLPPEEVPKELRFLIVGQPPEGYSKYPIWLKDNRDDISVWKIEGIKKEDIFNLLKNSINLNEEHLLPATNLVSSIVDGNTLSTIFAVHEAKELRNVEELQKVLTERKLHNGISSYYQSIWNSAISQINNLPPFLDTRIAGCLSITSERLNGSDLSEIFKEYGYPKTVWGDFLRKLRPLIIEEHDGFRVAHNDVRVHLMREINTEPTQLREVASNMADYYWTDKNKALVRHSSLFDLLKLSNRESEQIKLYTPEYVMEGVALRRPLKELQSQCKSVIINLPKLADWESLHTFSLACTTLNQFQKVSEWSGENLEYIEELPPLLSTEGSVLNINDWDLDKVYAVVQDAKRLISENELSRAKGLMSRWFSDITPFDLISIIGEENLIRGVNKSLSDKANNFFEDFGIVCQHTGLLFDNNSQEEKSNKLVNNCFSSFYGSYITEAVNVGGTLRFIRSLKKAQTLYYSDLESWLIKLAKNRRWLEVSLLLHKIKETDSLPVSFKVTAGFCSIFAGYKDLNEKWSNSIIESGFEFLTNYDENNYEKRPVLYAMVSFILGWGKAERETGGISQDGVNHYFRNSNHEKGREHLLVLLNASAMIGKWMRFLFKKNNSDYTNVFSIKYVIQVLNALLKHRHPNEQLSFNHFNLTSSLIELIIECCKQAGDVYERSCYSFIKEYCSEKFPVNFMLKLGWKYLEQHGDRELLEKWFDHWVGPNGMAWHEDVSFRLEIVNELTVLANNSGMSTLVEQALLLRDWGLISYTGHKEYIFNELLPWFNELSKAKPNSWEVEGKKLLEISQEASKVGDNRMESSLLNEVAIAIAVSGPCDMWRFYNAENLTDNILNHPHILMDGIIGMLEVYNVTEKEAMILWSLGIGTLNWQNEIDRIYLDDLKEALILASQRSGIHDISNGLEGLGKSEFYSYGSRVKYRVPARWFFTNSVDSSTEWLELKETLETEDLGSAITFLQDYKNNATNREQYVWKGYACICNRLEKEKPLDFLLHLNQLKAIITNSQIGWSTDDTLLGFNTIAPMLQESEKWSVIHGILNNIDFNNSYWITPLSEILNGFCFYQSKLGGTDTLQHRFNRILETHLLWINGNGFLPKADSIILPDAVDEYPLSWKEFALKYFLEILQSNNSSRIELALRGIWALIQTSPDGTKECLDKIQEADNRIKEWMLIIAERVATSIPENFNYFSEFVKRCYESDALNLKFQALAVYYALNRSTGDNIPELQFSEHSSNSLLKQLDENGPRLMQIPSIKQGAFYSINGKDFVRSSLAFIEEATKDDVLDIEKKLVNYLKVSPEIDSNFKKVKMNSGEVQLVHVPEKYKLMDVLYHEVSLGRWYGIPPLRFAQAITPGDDPFILLDTPTPADDIEVWPIDEKLDKLIEGDKEHLKNCFLENINAGISEDEIVIGAVLFTYSYSNDVIFHFDLTLFEEDIIKGRNGGSRVFNGRSFGFYEDLRFDPYREHNNTLAQMTYQTGGISYFSNQTFSVYPSLLWSDLFAWEPSKNNPKVWLHQDKVVVRHDYIHGPYRELYHGRLDRQPILQRWVCNKTIFEQTLKEQNIVNQPFSSIKINEQ